MRGGLILIFFFLIFTIVTLLVPCQMFPGNLLCISIGKAISGYAEYMSAVFNGVFYGVIMWLVFAGVSRRLEQEK